MNIPPRFQRWTGQGTLEVLAEALFAWSEKIARTMADLWLPDVDAAGNHVPGNVEGEMVVVTFTTSGADQQVAHRLGHAPRNITPCGIKILDKDGNLADAHATVSEGGRAPGDQVVTLRCKFDPPATKVIFRAYLHGGRRRPR